MILIERVDGAEEVDGRVRSFDDPDCGFGGGAESACGKGAEKDRDSDESSEEVHGFLSGWEQDCRNGGSGQHAEVPAFARVSESKPRAPT